MISPFAPFVGPEIFKLRPDYCAISVAAEGIENASTHPAVDDYVEDLIARSELPLWGGDHLEAWRAAYRAFGAKPQRTPCSAEALRTRLSKDGRLPAINAVVDLYNAVSVRFTLPVGGENIAAYVGSPRLIRASGTEPFETNREGVAVVETVPSGEVVWADDRGVTCRRWNWRQCTRTRIDLLTRQMWFVLERLEPMPLSATQAAAGALTQGLRRMNPAAQFSAHLIDRQGVNEIQMA